jgi:hypothetical protein
MARQQDREQAFLEAARRAAEKIRAGAKVVPMTSLDAKGGERSRSSPDDPPAWRAACRRQS